MGGRSFQGAECRVFLLDGFDRRWAICGLLQARLDSRLRPVGHAMVLIKQGKGVSASGFYAQIEGLHVHGPFTRPMKR